MHEQQNAEFAEEDSTQQDVLIDSAVVNMHFNRTNEKQSVSSSIKDMEKQLKRVETPLSSEQ